MGKVRKTEAAAKCFLSSEGIPQLASGPNIPFAFISIGHDGAAKSDAIQ